MSKFSRAFRAFQKVKTLKPNRSVFDLSHDILTTGDMGKLYPCCFMEMSPGDTFHIWNQNVIRMQPMNAPILHPIHADTHFFFVPYRILWEEWTEFITGGVDGESGGTSFDNLPTVSPLLPRWSPTNNAVGSLWDYCGFPVGVVPNGALPLDFLRRCYNRIWNEYYRDENLQEEVSEDNESILNRSWKKDYFTSALKGQQRGISPALPFSGIGLNRDEVIHNVSLLTAVTPTNISRTFTIPDSIAGYSLTREIFDSIEVSLIKSTPSNWNSDNIGTASIVRSWENRSITISFSISNSPSTPVGGGYTGTIHLPYSSVQDSSGVNIKDLRVAFQIQRWLELANRGGVRYTEFLRSFFGVSPRDDRLQRPEYIGGTKTSVIVSEVLQTSSTASEPTALGNMAGHGLAANSTYVGSYTAVEFGIVMGLFSIMPNAKYQQGINRQWLRRTKFDFLFPQFTHLSETAIEEAEIYATNDETENRKVFGFNEIYDELRAIPSLITGKMRTTFDYWHLGRKFSAPPRLNSDFIKCEPSKRIFAVPSEDGFIISIGNVIRAVRPLPKYGTPGGI